MTPFHFVCISRFALACRTAAILGALLVFAAPGLANAQQNESTAKESSENGWIFTGQFANDLFGNTDQHFTHGMRFAAMSPSGRDSIPGWVVDLADNIPFFNISARRHVVFSVGQSMFTPDDISATQLIRDDRPYAGWLYGGVGLVSVSGKRLDNLELNLGVVGPASFAEDVQTTWHKWFDFQSPNGWDNQLKNEPGFVLNYERKWRHVRPAGLFGLDVGMTPHVGGSIGNVLTQASGGITFRIGGNLADRPDFGPPRIRPSLPGSDYFARGRGISWYLFFGGEARGVARNIFLDGNTFTDSHSVNKKILVGDVQAGIAVMTGRLRVAYTQVYRTREFEGQDAPDFFGAFSVSYMW